MAQASTQARTIMRRPEESRPSGTSTATTPEGPSATSSELGIEAQVANLAVSQTQASEASRKAVLSREQRQAKYDEARERIFGREDEANKDQSADGNDLSRNSSASGKKKAPVKKPRNMNDEDDDFEPRSQFYGSSMSHAYARHNNPSQYYHANYQPSGHPGFLSDQGPVNYMYPGYVPLDNNWQGPPMSMHPMPGPLPYHPQNGHYDMSTPQYPNAPGFSAGPFYGGANLGMPPDFAPQQSLNHQPWNARQFDQNMQPLHPQPPFGYLSNPSSPHGYGSNYGNNWLPHPVQHPQQPPIPQYPSHSQHLQYTHQPTVPSHVPNHQYAPMRPQFNPQTQSFVPNDMPPRMTNMPQMPGSGPFAAPRSQVMLPHNRPLPSNYVRQSFNGLPANLNAPNKSNNGIASSSSTSAIRVPSRDSAGQAAPGSSSSDSNSSMLEITVKWGKPQHLPPKPPPPEPRDPRSFPEHKKGYSKHNFKPQHPLPQRVVAINEPASTSSTNNSAHEENRSDAAAATQSTAVSTGQVNTASNGQGKAPGKKSYSQVASGGPKNGATHNVPNNASDKKTAGNNNSSSG